MGKIRHLYFISDWADNCYWVVIALNEKDARKHVSKRDGDKNPDWYGLIKMPRLEINDGRTRIIHYENYVSNTPTLSNGRT
jgi:hypothetical protein